MGAINAGTGKGLLKCLMLFVLLFISAEVSLAQGELFSTPFSINNTSGTKSITENHGGSSHIWVTPIAGKLGFTESDMVSLNPKSFLKKNTGGGWFGKDHWHGWQLVLQEWRSQLTAADDSKTAWIKVKMYNYKSGAFRDYDNTNNPGVTVPNAEDILFSMYAHKSGSSSDWTIEYPQIAGKHNKSPDGWEHTLNGNSTGWALVRFQDGVKKDGSYWDTGSVKDEIKVILTFEMENMLFKPVYGNAGGAQVEDVGASSTWINLELPETDELIINGQQDWSGVAIWGNPIFHEFKTNSNGSGGYDYDDYYMPKIEGLYPLDQFRGIYWVTDNSIDGGKATMPYQTLSDEFYSVGFNTSHMSSLLKHGSPQFYTHGNSFFAQDYTFLSNWNPNYSLSNYRWVVKGGMAAKGVDVSTNTLSSGWPDYVFDQDYELMDMDELSGFITQNGHLPGIPSEKEVVEQGFFSADELSVKLLEKIEELTRYAVDRRSRLDALLEQIETLKSEKHDK